MAKRSTKKQKAKEATARHRSEVILRVQSGQITATEGAAMLGVSRKTYYKWENRALAAMADALEDKDQGRPGPTSDDLQKQRMEEENQHLRERLRCEEERRKLQNMSWELKVDLIRKEREKK